MAQGDRSSALDQLRHAASLGIDEAVSLPPRCYRDPAIYELEQREIFGRDWIHIGRACDISEPGDYLAADLPGAAVMAVRQKDGSIKVLSRVCRHRGALVASEGSGHSGVFSCPYHRWTYELDGRLRAAPTMEGNPAFKRENCALPEFRMEIWQGFIFVTLSADAAPLGAALAPLSVMIDKYDIGDWRSAFSVEDVWDTNWKVAFENACESYHHIGFHQHSLDPIWPGLTTQPGKGDEAFNFHVVPSIPDFRYREVEGVTLDDGAMSHFFICGIYPSLTLVLAGPSTIWFSFEPLSVDRVRVRAGQLNPAAYFDAPNLEEMVAGDRAMLVGILEEDKVGCLGVQQGLSMADAASGPLSPLERPIAEFVRYLARRLAA
ncbi:MAG: aromatic ring-hydroxylating dioxygenase subunit alpha [Parvibaculum sp.]|uniref:aromatic ring-hydroxylating oxygenase subunit alpha n=1 Tax=Parvibaculum sp. TaxID=2024848 RepID=UPI003C71288B